MELGLKGKVAVVAGASRGIGLATAARLRAEGATVVMVGRDEQNLARAALRVSGSPSSEEVAVMPADVCSEEQTRGVVEAIERRWGRIDILVSAVGQGVRSTIDSADLTVWEENWRTNLMSAVTLARAVIPLMRRPGGGRVVLLGAASGIQPTPGQLVSNVHKSAVIALGKSLALELASENILVNVVCPGRILTERRAARLKDEAAAAGVTEEEYLDHVARTIPLGAWGTPDHVASMIVFLCSEPAAYITGQVIAVDGGLGRGTYS
jgi:3-oxoacyl-[acyl-carrier protein] reductase